MWPMGPFIDERFRIDSYDTNTFVCGFIFFFQALNKLREEVRKSLSQENKLTASSAKVRPLSQMRI